MFHHTPEKWHQLVPDLLKDDVAFAVHRHYFVLGAAGWVAPALVGGLAAGPGGALSGFLWGGLVRTLLVHHATWCVNSICHAHGARPHETRDRSTNHALVAWLTMGEGWHNNHHASPVAARHGQGWRQPDVTWFLIESLERLGLVSEVR
jgi:stearoyl-CoA desaturase (delta-9 desaturase)